MNKTEIVNRISGAVGRAGLRLKKHSPEILVVTGVVGIVASAVIACRATTKISEILEPAKEELDAIHHAMATEPLETYSEEDGKKELTIVYVRTGVQLAKLYAPAVVLGALSIVSILASNDILRKRYGAMTAAYAAVDRGFKEYQHRVAERFGEETEREIRYGIKAKEIEETVTDENGKEKKVKKTVNVADSTEHSPYARFYDDGCEGWQKDSEYNLMFLRAEQNYANDRLKARGYLFLNEVYERLGIPTTKAGQMVGWVYKPDDPKYSNYVDFGIYDMYRQKCREFVNGHERTILLDFNVDGDILDLI